MNAVNITPIKAEKPVSRDSETAVWLVILLLAMAILVSGAVVVHKENARQAEQGRAR